MFKPDGDLRALFINDKRILSSPEPIHVRCLFHSEHTASLAIYPDHAYCYGQCNKWYGYKEIMRKIGAGFSLPSPPPKQERSIPTIAELERLVEKYHEQLFRFGKSDYYKQRGISEDSIRRCRLGYTGAAFSIPIKTPTGLYTIRFRRDEEVNMDGAKYWGIYGLNQSALYTPSILRESIILCEGEFDAIIGMQCGYSSCSFTNGINTVSKLDTVELSQIFNTVERIQVAVDQDETSYGVGLRIVKRIRGLGKDSRIVKFPYKDLTELYLAKGEEGVRKYVSYRF